GVGRKPRGTTGVPWSKPILAAGNGSSAMHCARKPMSVEQPKWHLLSTSSTVSWRWDARATSALHEAKRAWDHRVQPADPCNKVIWRRTSIVARRSAPTLGSPPRYLRFLDSLWGDLRELRLCSIRSHAIFDLQHHPVH